MKLSDVVGGAGLSGYAEIALLIFCTVFVLTALRLLLGRRAEFDRAARIPLDDESDTIPPGTPGS